MLHKKRADLHFLVTLTPTRTSKFSGIEIRSRRARGRSPPVLTLAVCKPFARACFASAGLVRLFQIASEQGGYFTAGQARQSGFSKALLAHHAGEGGRFIRVRRGLYRFRQYPASPREGVLAAWLAVDREEAVVSHESALELLGLSDVVPEAVHVTVPRSKRSRPATPGIRVHTTTRKLAPADVVVREGVQVTSPVRSIMDASEAGTAPEQVIAATIQALDRGMTTESQLLSAAGERSDRTERLVIRALEEWRRS
ncbi:MAG: type IV toxin-antitoxin system AbiEi family antitoxin domain-containing protein [bacterium]